MTIYAVVCKEMLPVLQIDSLWSEEINADIRATQMNRHDSDNFWEWVVRKVPVDPPLKKDSYWDLMGEA